MLSTFGCTYIYPRLATTMQLEDCGKGSYSNNQTMNHTLLHTGRYHSLVNQLLKMAEA